MRDSEIILIVLCGFSAYQSLIASERYSVLRSQLLSILDKASPDEVLNEILSMKSEVKNQMLNFESSVSRNFHNAAVAVDEIDQMIKSLVAKFAATEIAEMRELEAIKTEMKDISSTCLSIRSDISNIKIPDAPNNSVSCLFKDNTQRIDALEANILQAIKNIKPVAPDIPPRLCGLSGTYLSKLNTSMNYVNDIANKLGVTPIVKTMPYDQQKDCNINSNAANKVASMHATLVAVAKKLGTQLYPGHSD